MAYAETTEVSVEKTRAEIESLLAKRQATRFAYMTDDGNATIGFVINKLGVRFNLPLPSASDKRFIFTSHSKPRRRHEADAYKLWEQACRSRWRALFLCIKAKLEACEAGITTFEAEFLAHIVLPGGDTMGEEMVPQILAMRDSGKAPTLQIGWNGAEK